VFEPKEGQSVPSFIPADPCRLAIERSVGRFTHLAPHLRRLEIGARQNLCAASTSAAMR
jgi:hypothetical protein